MAVVRRRPRAAEKDVPIKKAPAPFAEVAGNDANRALGRLMRPNREGRRSAQRKKPPRGGLSTGAGPRLQARAVLLDNEAGGGRLLTNM
jgi:hypothetical protein